MRCDGFSQNLAPTNGGNGSDDEAAPPLSPTTAWGLGSGKRAVTSSCPARPSHFLAPGLQPEGALSHVGSTARWGLKHHSHWWARSLAHGWQHSSFDLLHKQHNSTPASFLMCLASFHLSRLFSARLACAAFPEGLPLGVGGGLLPPPPLRVLGPAPAATVAISATVAASRPSVAARAEHGKSLAMSLTSSYQKS